MYSLNSQYVCDVMCYDRDGMEFPWKLFILYQITFEPYLQQCGKNPVQNYYAFAEIIIELDNEKHHHLLLNC